MNIRNDHPVSDSADMDTGRRRFLQWFTVGVSAVGAALVGVPVAGYILGPLFRRIRREWRDVGGVDHFVVGDTVLVSFRDSTAESWSGETAKTGAWLRRVSTQEFVAYSINCTHLGCPVRWEPKAKLFMCPCHGGVYYQDGVVAAGPPPLPLRHYPVRVKDNRVEIQTSPVPIT